MKYEPIKITIFTVYEYSTLMAQVKVDCNFDHGMKNFINPSLAVGKKIASSGALAIY